MHSNSAVESSHSVTRYIDGLRKGDVEATQKIWERFIQRLVQLANSKLRNSSRSSVDEEDVVQQAFADFFSQVKQGRFPKLNDRNDLWQVLAMLVDRRAKDQIRRQYALRSGGGRVINGNSVGLTAGVQEVDLISSVPSRTPCVSEAMDFVDALRNRLALLKDQEQRSVALLKLQGYSNREIADKIDSSLRTVERTLNRIRSIWEDVWSDLGD